VRRHLSSVESEDNLCPWLQALVWRRRWRDRYEGARCDRQPQERALEAEKVLRETEAELARVMRALSLGELASSIAHENQRLVGVVTNAEASLR